MYILDNDPAWFIFFQLICEEFYSGFFRNLIIVLYAFNEVVLRLSDSVELLQVKSSVGSIIFFIFSQNIW